MRTPKKTRDWERYAAHVIKKSCNGAHLDCPVKLKITCVAARPKSFPKTKRLGRAWKGTKPDLSNVIKAVEDALVKSGVLRDDALVVRLEAEDFYAAIGEEPCVEVELTEV